MLRAHTAVVSQTVHQRTLGDVLPDTATHGLVEDILGNMPDAWRDTVIPCAIVHGDFAPWNARMAGDDLFLFDWTNGAESGPAFYDRLYLEHQLHRLISRGEPRECAAMLSRIAGSEYASLDAGVVVRAYLVWRLADAVANDNESDVTEIATIWDAFLGGVEFA